MTGVAKGAAITEGQKKRASADAAPGDAVQTRVDDREGGGRSVVLVHGWPLSARAWELQLSGLHAAGYRTVACERRRFSRSEQPESGSRYQVLAADVQRVLERCGLQDVTLLGCTMDGGEVTRYIGRYGDAGLHACCSPRRYLPA